MATKDEVHTPKTNFFQFVNGKWLNDPSIVIPDEYPRWGGFMILRDESLKAQIQIMKEISSKVEQGSAKLSSEEMLLGLAWTKSLQRFADWDAGKGDYTSLSLELQQLNNKLTEGDFYNGLSHHFARCQRIGISYPFGFSSGSNLKDSKNDILNMGADGLSLPSREYYFDSKFESQRAMFVEHLTNVVKLLTAQDGIDLDADFVQRVVRFERKLAQIRMTPSQRRLFDKYFTITSLDGVVDKMNELKSLDEKQDLYEGDKSEFKGDADEDVLSAKDYKLSEEDLKSAGTFLNTMYDDMRLSETLAENYSKHYGEGSQDEIMKLSAFDGDYFRRVFGLLFREHNKEDLICYLQYKIIKSAQSYCSKELDEEFFDFYARKLQGNKVQQSHEKRTVNLVNAWLGYALGKVYVGKHFSEDDKNTVREMIKQVIGVMSTSLSENDWLSEETKKKGLAKLENFTVKIGYPDKWRTYDNLHFDKNDSLLMMRQKVLEFEFKKDFLDEINTPKDETKWEMTPQTVNAYFHPLNNEIVFPASILQPPFYMNSTAQIDFDWKEEKDAISGDADFKESGVLAAANFGAIGAVIAHEITHGFDDQGRKFDHEGNVNDWWTEDDATAFLAKADLINQQADAYTFVDEGQTHHMNGKLTTGENLADLGGMSLAVKAMLRQEHYNKSVINSTLKLNHLRIYFKSWANIWKSKATNAYRIKMLAIDPHAPADFRGNAVKNNKYFYEAFGIKNGDPMYLEPEKRVYMW